MYFLDIYSPNLYNVASYLFSLLKDTILWQMCSTTYANPKVCSHTGYRKICLYFQRCFSSASNSYFVCLEYSYLFIHLLWRWVRHDDRHLLSVGLYRTVAQNYLKLTQSRQLRSKTILTTAASLISLQMQGSQSDSSGRSGMNSVLSICVLSMSCSSVIMFFFLGISSSTSKYFPFPFFPINLFNQRLQNIKWLLIINQSLPPQIYLEDQFKFTSIKLSINQMFQDKPISQVNTDNEQSEGTTQLNPTFFINLHKLEMKFMRLRYKQHLKKMEEQLITIMEQLLANYTDCIDYFSSLSEHVYVYYLAKLKDMSKYYELVKKVYAKQTLNMTLINNHNTDKDQLLTIQDLGSITSQTRSRVSMLINQNDQSLDSKDVFNQSVMLCLQNQNVKIHLQENMKKKEKVQTKIVESLQTQIDDIELRISNRKIKIHKKQISKSFSESTTFQADLLRKSKPFEIEQIEQLSNFDLDALEADSPQKLKQLIESKIDK